MYVKRVISKGRTYFYLCKKVNRKEWTIRRITEEEAKIYKEDKVLLESRKQGENSNEDKVATLFEELSVIKSRLSILESKDNGDQNNVVPLQNVPKKNNSNNKPISLSVLQSGKTYGKDHGALMSELKSVLKNRRQDAN